MKKHIKLLSIAAIIVPVLSMQTFAQSQVEITQKGKQFSEKSLTLKVGDKISFVNDDNVAHNVYSRAGSTKEDLGLQKPGEKGELVFSKPGRYRVRCAIHPKMKMTVVVE